MLKRILILLIACLLCSCSKEVPKDEDSILYIEPVRSVRIFDELDPELQNRIRMASGDSDPGNYKFRMLFKDVYDGQLQDIDGETISLRDYDRLFVEVVSVKCSHCKKQLEYIDEFSRKQDVTLLQYFNVGDRDQIIAFYEEAGVAIPENIIIVPNDADFKDYLLKELGIELYPTMLSYYDGKLSFIFDGEMDMEQYEKFYDISFVNRLSEEDLVDEQGNSIIKKERTIDDVRDSLSQDNLSRLQELDNDGITSEFTFSIMGSVFDYDSKDAGKNGAFINEIDDYERYRSSRTVLIYVSLKNTQEVHKVEYVNELIKGHDGYEFIVVLVEGMDSSSVILSNMNVKFSCPVVSLSADLPQGFYIPTRAEYPYAVFVDRSVVTGGYSNIESKEKFAEALDLFLSEDSIAYVKNN